MTYAWIMFISGCTFVGLAAWRLWIREGEPRSLPWQAGLGQVLIGAGLAFNGVPTIVGWSLRTGSTVAGIDLLVIAVGAALQVYVWTLTRGRRQRPAG